MEWDPPALVSQPDGAPLQVAPAAARLENPPLYAEQIELITDGRPIGDGDIPPGAVTGDAWTPTTRQAIRLHGAVRARIDRAEHRAPVATIERDPGPGELAELCARFEASGVAVVQLPLALFARMVGHGAS